MNRFTYLGKVYKPGDIVDLPLNYRGERWLEVVDKKVAKPMVPVAPKVEEPKEETAVPEVPLLEKAESKKSAKKK